MAGTRLGRDAIFEGRDDEYVTVFFRHSTRHTSVRWTSCGYALTRPVEARPRRLGRAPTGDGWRGGRAPQRPTRRLAAIRYAALFGRAGRAPSKRRDASATVVVDSDSTRTRAATIDERRVASRAAAGRRGVRRSHRVRAADELAAAAVPPFVPPIRPPFSSLKKSAAVLGTATPRPTFTYRTMPFAAWQPPRRAAAAARCSGGRQQGRASTFTSDASRDASLRQETPHPIFLIYIPLPYIPQPPIKRSHPLYQPQSALLYIGTYVRTGSLSLP